MKIVKICDRCNSHTETYLYNPYKLCEPFLCEECLNKEQQEKEKTPEFDDKEYDTEDDLPF